MKRKRLIIIFLFLGLTLIACNLANTITENLIDEDTVSETIENLMETPTEEVVEPTSEVLAEPTEQPAVAMDTSNEMSSASSRQQSACDHPYFPMREGATWVYQDVSSGDYYHWQVDSVSGDLQNAEAVMTVYINDFSEPTDEQKQAGIQIEYNWVCSATDGIVSFDLATLSIPEFEDQSFSFTLENIVGEGVMIPPAEQLQPGFTWQLTLSGEFNMEAFMGTTGTMQATDFYTVLNQDPVDINGETFEGLQYQREFQNEMEISLNGVPMTLPNIDFDFQTKTVMAKGIGYVKLDTDSDFGDTGLQLVRYQIP